MIDETPYFSASQANNTGATAQVLSSFPSLLSAGGIAVLDPSYLQITVINGAGSGQNITSGSISFTDTIGGVPVTITYQLPIGAAVVPNSASTYIVPVPQGVLKNMSVTLNYAANPSASTVGCLVTFRGTDAPQPSITIIRSVGTTASGDTAAWTPASGKRFRLLGYNIEITGNVLFATAGVQVIILKDSATNMFQHRCFIPQTTAFSVSEDYSPGPIFLPGQGYLSLAVNNVLNINLGTGLTAGVVHLCVWGTEE